MAFYYESTTHLTTFAMYTIAWQRAVYLFKAAPTAPSTQSRLYGNLSLQQLVREYLFSPIFQSAYSANTMNSLVARSRTCSSAVPVPRSQLALSSRHLAQQQRGPSAPKGVQFNEQFMEVLQQSLEREEQRIADKIGLPGLYLHEAVEEEAIEGTGTLIWAAGVRLSQHLVKNRANELKGARVLDLGTGTGIVGIAAAALGAHVMLTDTRDILPQVYENVQQNSQLIEASGGSATVAELDWNEPDDEVLDQDYDWVFGSDVTYTEETLQPLAKLLRQMILTNEGAVVKLAHMHRNKELDKAMREIFHDEGLMLRPVDVRTTGTTKYEDPLHVDEAIAFYRVSMDPALRELLGEAQ